MPADKILSQRVRELVSESQAYMELVEYERKLDSIIMHKRLNIQEALKGPVKQKRKLRIYLSSIFYPSKPEGENGEMSIPSWELRVEGRLVEDATSTKVGETSRIRHKFSSFLKSLVIELDKDIYGPDNNLVEWHRHMHAAEADGFQVKRPGAQNVECTIILVLDYQPMQFRLDQRLACLLGVHTQTRATIINALWQYIKTHSLQDPYEREFINCDPYLEQIFEAKRMRFAEIPSKLHRLLAPPDPIVINHIVNVEDPYVKKTVCHEVEVEIDDSVRQQMASFLMSTHSQQEIAALDRKIHDLIVNIDELKVNHEFFASFARDIQAFITNWLISQTKDLKTMTGAVGNPEEERCADFQFQPWSQEAVCRYLYAKVQQRRLELEQALNIQSSETPPQK